MKHINPSITIWMENWVIIFFVVVAKVKTEPEEKQAKFSNRDFSNTLVLTVTHPPVNPQSTVSQPSTVNQSMSSTKFRGPVTGSQTCLKVEKTGEKRHKPFRKLTVESCAGSQILAMLTLIVWHIQLLTHFNKSEFNFLGGFVCPLPMYPATCPAI